MESPSLHSFWVISICAFGWETISEIGEGLKMWIYILSVPNIYFKCGSYFYGVFGILMSYVEELSCIGETFHGWLKKSQLVVFPIFFSHWSSGVSTSAW